MSKRIIAMLLALTLVAACLPVGVVAEEAPAQHTCEHCQQVPEWTDWDGTTALEDGKHYKLTAEELKPTEPIALTAGTYVLCLNGNTISGATAGRIFDLSGTASLTIVDHTAKEDNGVYTAGKLSGATNSAVAVSGTASFTMYDGIMENNRSSGDGGAIRNDNGQGIVRIYGGLFRNNHARYGAVIYMLGNRANQWTVQLHLENALITGNTSSSTGAIHCEGLTKSVIKNTEISGNSTTSTLTGGMYVTSAEAELTLSGKVIIDDNTNRMQETNIINRNLVINNVATVLKVDGLAQGSRIQLKASKGTDPTTVIVPANQTSWDCSWIILGEESVSWTDANADGIVQASELVAGHYHNGEAYTAVTGNTELPTTGGNFYLTQDVNRSAVTAFNKNTNLCLNGHNIVSTGTSRLIQTTANTTTVLTIEDCAAYTDAAGVYHAGAITGADMSSAGTVYINAGTTLKLYGGKISGNTASAAAGVYNVGTFYMYGGEISNNKATTGTSGRHGGGVYNAGAFYMEGGTICNNEAGNYGGGVFSNKPATITGGTISGNKADQGGGVGLYNNNTFVIGAVTITGNTATTEGGGLWVSSAADVTLNGTVITENTSEDNGGGVVARGKAKVKLLAGEISKNTAANNMGGGLYAAEADTQVTVEGGKISGNSAKFGGGAFTISGAKLTLKGGSIEKNAATAQGGGLYVNAGTNFYMEGGAITGNTAKRLGGGIYNVKSTSHISGGTIENNHSDEGGGGIAHAGDETNPSTLNLSGGTITGNTAPVSGGIATVASSVLNISGNPQVIGNAAGEKASNLHLEGDALLMNVGTMSDGAKVSVSGVPFRAISAPVATDCSSAFVSDSSLYAVKYQSGALYLDVAVEHNHCACGGASANGCDHTQQEFIPWDGTTGLTAGNYYLTDDVVVTAQIKIENGTLNLCLNGHTIQVGDQGGRVFYVSDNGKLNITDCQGGGKIAGATKGAILTNGSGKAMEVNLYSGAITENHSADNGGAVIVQGDSTFNMYGGEISGNSTIDGKHGGGVFVLTDATFKLFGGAISGNTSGANGGAIYSNGGKLELSGGTISGNAAVKDGGGIYLNKSTMTLTKTVVEKNSAVNGAGVCVFGASQLTVSGGKISGNTAGEAGVGGGIFATGEGTKVVMTGGEISGNTAKAGGGVITQTKSTFTLQGGTITGNKAGASGGGGVYVSTGTTFTMQGGTISKNESAGAGGGVYQLKSTASFAGGTISENKAVKDGGGVYLNESTATLSKTVVEKNSAVNGAGYCAYGASELTVSGGKLSGNTAGEAGVGGGIFATGEGTKVVMTGGEISGNTAKAGGGVITQTKSTFTLQGGTITGNKAGTSGGGGVYVSTGTTFTMQGGTISKNESAGAGGGVYQLRSTASFTGGEISGNAADKEGGGIMASGGTMTLNNITVSGNSAATNGGGIALLAPAQKDADGKVTGYIPSTAELLEGAVITANQASATGTGGGVFVSGEGSSLLVDGGTISKNTAKYGGGVITQTKSSITLKSGAITENTSSSNGGGVYISTNTTLNMEGGEISKNSSKLNGGGAFFLNSNLNMTGGKVSNNTAKTDGGGMYLQLCNTVFKGGSVTGNSAKNAGGIRITGGKHSISGLTVSYNTADSDGGGLQIGRQMVKENGVNVDKLPEFTMYSGTFVGNKAKNGGAILLLSNKAVYTIYNAYIAENEATNGGGGIYVSTGATLNMYGGTITKNFGKTGGGIMMLLSSGNYENVEISGNTGNNAPALMINKPSEHGDIRVKNMKILNNVGSASGAIVVQGGAVLYMEDSQFNGNSTEKTGGAIFTTTGGESYIKNTTFEGNSAGADAGAVMLGLNSVCELDGCTISGNSAATNGGGIYNRGLMYVKNSKVLNNTCGNNGAGIGSGKTGSTHTGDKCGLYIENVISSGNTAEGNGGGLFGSLGCHVVATNLTLTDNEAKGNGGGAWVQEDFMVENLTATGNTASIGAVYLAASHHDGQSYFCGVMKFTGKVLVKDNQGGGVFVGERTTLTLAGDGLEEGSYMDVTLHSGVLTQKVFGVYDYEGGDLNYVVTPGNRSVLEPEALKQSGDTDAAEGSVAAADVILYVGVGVFVVAIAAVVAVLVMKKKKAGTAAETQE